MTKVLAAASGLFRDRDFFVHDGTQLRRFRLSASVQIVFAAALLTLVGWSSYAVARILTPAPVAIAAQVSSTADYAAKVAQLAAETERRVKLIEDRQLALAAALANEDIDQATLRRMGFYPPQAGHEGRGGPFDGNADPTFKQLFTSWKKLDNLASGAIAVPSDKPVKTAAFTSGYGVRSDPFRGGAAMHAGIDLAGPHGTPIYATADGLVTTAKWNSGGYGNLIKVDHGRGIETRYGHLAQMLVQRRTAGEARPADRPHGLDRPLDRQPPPLRSAHRRPRREPDPLHEVDRLSGRHAEERRIAFDGHDRARRPAGRQALRLQQGLFLAAWAAPPYLACK